ncbi:MAG: AtpZ/AtpI family protein [Desulfobacteraceae bacterium]|nr:MAG: AtpZ/AtpI family protein [Desulfobacteraceae bacterium]
MKKETSEMLKELGYYSSLGLSVALSIFIGLYIGLSLDRWLGTAPWCMFIFFGLGIAAAASNILLAFKKSNKMK